MNYRKSQIFSINNDHDLSSNLKYQKTQTHNQELPQFRPPSIFARGETHHNFSNISEVSKNNSEVRKKRNSNYVTIKILKILTANTKQISPNTRFKENNAPVNSPQKFRNSYRTKQIVQPRPITSYKDKLTKRIPNYPHKSNNVMEHTYGRFRDNVSEFKKNTRDINEPKAYIDEINIYQIPPEFRTNNCPVDRNSSISAICMANKTVQPNYSNTNEYHDYLREGFINRDSKGIQSGIREFSEHINSRLVTLHAKNKLNCLYKPEHHDYNKPGIVRSTDGSHLSYLTEIDLTGVVTRDYSTYDNEQREPKGPNHVNNNTNRIRSSNQEYSKSVNDYDQRNIKFEWIKDAKKCDESIKYKKGQSMRKSTEKFDNLSIEGSRSMSSYDLIRNETNELGYTNPESNKSMTVIDNGKSQNKSMEHNNIKRSPRKGGDNHDRNSQIDSWNSSYNDNTATQSDYNKKINYKLITNNQLGHRQIGLTTNENNYNNTINFIQNQENNQWLSTNSSKSNDDNPYKQDYNFHEGNSRPINDFDNEKLNDTLLNKSRKYEGNQFIENLSGNFDNRAKNGNKSINIDNNFVIGNNFNEQYYETKDKYLNISTTIFDRGKGPNKPIESIEQHGLLETRWKDSNNTFSQVKNDNNLEITTKSIKNCESQFETGESMKQENNIKSLVYKADTSTNQYRQTKLKEYDPVDENLFAENTKMESSSKSQLLSENDNIESTCPSLQIATENNQDITSKSITNYENEYKINESIERENENAPKQNANTKINRYTRIGEYHNKDRKTSTFDENSIEKAVNESCVLSKNADIESEYENNKKITAQSKILNENQHERNEYITRENDNGLVLNNTETDRHTYEKEHGQVPEIQNPNENLIESEINIDSFSKSQQVPNDDYESDRSSSYCSSVKEKMGFDNPSSFCFFNSVIQVLRGCVHFLSAILKYHRSDKIEKIVATAELLEQNKIFVSYFCKLFSDLKRGKMDHEALTYLQDRFLCTLKGDDVNKCFMTIISILNNVLKEPKSRTSPGNSPDSIFKDNRNANHGFVFDCFYGQICFSVFCEKCQTDINTDYQLFTSLSLPVMESVQPILLQSCLNEFLEKSQIETDSVMNCKCASGTVDISLKCEITHAPRYLFLFLNRGSYISGIGKKNTFVKSDGTIDIPTFKGKKYYRLISVIDHIGTSDFGHFYCKCNYETDNWWLANDCSITNLGCCSIDQVISENTIVFLFKKIKTKSKK